MEYKICVTIIRWRVFVRPFWANVNFGWAKLQGQVSNCSSKAGKQSGIICKSDKLYRKKRGILTLPFTFSLFFSHLIFKVGITFVVWPSIKYLAAFPSAALLVWLIAKPRAISFMENVQKHNNIQHEKHRTCYKA